jgi:hypothetical protein
VTTWANRRQGVDKSATENQRCGANHGPDKRKPCPKPEGEVVEGNELDAETQSQTSKEKDAGVLV